MSTATREAYVAAALRLLARDGRAGLRIARLCSTLGVTSGSFYHHFGSWDGFVAALLEHWRAEETGRIVALAATPADPVERVGVLKHLVLTVPHEAETAIRAWAVDDPLVARAQARVDAERLRAVTDTLAPLIADPDLRARLAATGMALLAGHQQLAGVLGPDLAAVLDQYEILVRAHASGRWAAEPAGTAVPWADAARHAESR